MFENDSDSFIINTLQNKVKEEGNMQATQIEEVYETTFNYTYSRFELE